MELKNFLENFAEILEDTDASLVSETTDFKNLEEWDSMVALSLIAMVDDEYSVKLTGDDIKTSNTLEKLFNKVKAKI